MQAVLEVIAQDPEPSHRKLLFDWLGDDNAAKAGLPDGSDFAVLLRDADTGKVIGGLWGEDDLDWAFVSLIYVPPALRGQGLGERLMAKAESIARERGMIGIWLNTFDFQARGFYEKLGYTIFGALEREDRAAGQFFLKKRLT